MGKHYRYHNPTYNDITMGIQIFGKCSCTEQFSKKRILIECIQPHNPRRPEAEVAKELQKLIGENLGVDPTMIEIFTLMGTPLYYSTGVSAMIRFDGIELNIRAVINIYKYYGTSVDVLTDGGVEIPLEKTAREIAERIKRKQKRKNSRGRRVRVASQR